MKDEVDPTKFKKRLHNTGVADMQTALNVLALFQSYRIGDCVLDMEEIGLNPVVITAAINYILSHHHANVKLYQCYTCPYCKDDFLCTRPSNKCPEQENEE